MKVIDMMYTRNSRKHFFILAVLAIIGVTLIFTQYFGMISLADEKALDTLYYYNQTRFFEILYSLNYSDRLAYMLIHLADYIFILGLYPLIGLGLSKNVSQSGRYKLLLILPLLAGLFDILENLMMDIHLWFYPIEILALGSVAGVFTSLKFFILFISLIILVLAFILKLLKRKS